MSRVRVSSNEYTRVLGINAPDSWWAFVDEESRNLDMNRSAYVRLMVELSKRERREEIYMEMRSKIKELEEAVAKAEAIDDEPLMEPTLDELIEQGRRLRANK